MRVVDLHPVLGEGPRLVGADDCYRPHRLAGVHLADQVVGPEHAAHVERQAEGDAHGESFGDRHDDQRHGHHEVFQDDLRDGEPLVPARYRVDREVGMELFSGEDEECEDGDGKARPADEFGQPRQLDVERRLFGALFGRLACHFSDFGRVAHALHPHDAVPVGDRRAAQDGVGGVGGIGVERAPLDRFVHHELSREVRLVHLERNGLEQGAVRRNLLAGVEDHDVARHDLLARDLPDLSFAEDRYGRLLSHGVQQVEFPVGVVFEIEADARCQEDGEEDSDRFGVFSFDDRDDQREARRYEQHLDDRVLELFQIEPPHGGACGRGEEVLSV